MGCLYIWWDIYLASMILLKQLAMSILTEAMSFRQLFSRTDGGRRDRGKRMRVRSLAGTADEDRENWNFSYKSASDHITTGRSHMGRIVFGKDAYLRYKNKKSMDEVVCRVDCSCPDYRYRWAYANYQQDAGEMGGGSLNKCNGRPPVKMNPRQRPSLCKHLVSLKDYLRTKLEEERGDFGERLTEIVRKNPTFEIDVEEDEL